MTETKSQSKATKFLARLVALVVLVGPVGLAGCGGSVGVDDGTVIGTVFGAQTIGTGFNDAKPPIPLEDVTIVAQRQGGEPAVIRTTKSDVDGNWSISGLPTGEYLVGFAKRGFRTIDTAQGATNSRTAVGNQVRVFIEAEGTSIAPEVVMDRLPDEGDATVLVTLVDTISGNGVTNATVTVGNATSSESSSSGVYTLVVPVTQVGGRVPQQQIEVSAEGYDGAQAAPQLVRAIPNQTVSVTVTISPLPATISGRVNISKFDNLFNKTGISISAQNVPDGFLGNRNPAADGSFSINLPASNAVLQRQFTLRFTAPNLVQKLVTNVVVPGSQGTRELTAPVVMDPVFVDLVGQVLNSNGKAPNQQGAIPDTVTVRETGQLANIVNGSYTIPDVPATTTQTIGPASLNLDVSVFNPEAQGQGQQGTPGAQETGEKNITPIPDGTNNPTFTVPLIETQ